MLLLQLLTNLVKHLKFNPVKCFRSGNRGHTRRTKNPPPPSGNATNAKIGLQHIVDQPTDRPRDALIVKRFDASAEDSGADDGGGGPRDHQNRKPRKDAEDCIDDEVLYHIAVAESLQYQGLPELVDLNGFQGFKLEEVGQSSKNAQHVLDAYCNICMERKFSFECMDMKGCGHAYCACCLSQYVMAKVEANEALIACPDPECKTGLLQPEMCRFIISPEVFDRWGTRLCEEGIVEPTKLYCPYKDCSVLLIDEGEDDGRAIVESQCPHCKRKFCAKCKVPWHSGFKCKEYQNLGSNERSREDMMLMKLADHKKWRRCPKCGFFVEKTYGCNYIRCRCRHSFCYKCAGAVNDVDHRCSKCKLWG